jgi:SAM-dependent methyltransferase
VVALTGDAQHLPLPDRAYDRAMANHMLFHVPDQRAALRELHRVLKPGGRVLLATNAADHSARLRSLHEQAARQLGFVPAPVASERFNLDHLALVQEVFPDAERHVRHDAFVFPSVESVLRFYASGPVDAIHDAPADGSHRQQLLELVGEQVARIIAQEGVLRVPKDAGCFVAEVTGT